MCVKVMSILCTLVLVHLSQVVRAIQITGTSPPSNMLVEEGGTVSLLCQTDQRWFLCLWNSPLGNKVCAIQESDEGASQVCQGDPRIMVQGDAINCGITVTNVTRDDWGAWMCLVQDGEEFKTDRREIDMEVARKGTVGLEFDEWMSNRTYSQRVLRITEGTTTNISCRSLDAYPRPSFSWSGTPDGPVSEYFAREGRYVAEWQGIDGWYGNITVVEEGEHSFDGLLNLYNSRSTIIYLANLNDTNSSISCYVQQSDMYGNLLYQTQESILLLVDPVPTPPLPVSLSAQIGMISGLLITVIFLLLVCVLVTAVMCRRQKQARSSSCDSSVYQSDYIKPIWTTMNSARPNYSSNTLSTGLVSSDNRVNDECVRDSVANSDSDGNKIAHSSEFSYRQNSALNGHRYKISENQRQLPIPVNRIPQGRPGSPIYETHFCDTQSEVPVTLLHPPGLFLCPSVFSENRTRSISCIEPPNRKVSSTRSEGFPCCSQSRPVSSLGVDLSQESSKKMSTTTLPLFTSSSSLFQCAHDCFIEENTAEEELSSLAVLVQQQLEEALGSLDKMVENERVSERL